MEKKEAEACLFGWCYTDATMQERVHCEGCASVECVLHEEYAWEGEE